MLQPLSVRDFRIVSESDKLLTCLITLVFAHVMNDGPFSIASQIVVFVFKLSQRKSLVLAMAKNSTLNLVLYSPRQGLYIIEHQVFGKSHAERHPFFA